MTIRHRSLVHASFIIILIVLLPVAARPQEKTDEQPVNQEQNQTGEPAKPEAALSPRPDDKEPSSEPAPNEAPADAALTPSLPPEKPGAYSIKQGDTLWDIANTALKDPFLWPIIWKANPGITNPDLIYPDSKLTIPSIAPMERAMASEKPVVEKDDSDIFDLKENAGKTPPGQTVSPETPAEAAIQQKKLVQQKPAGPAAASVEQEAPVESLKTILPEETAAPLMDKYSMLNAGFINNSESSDVILDSEAHKTIMGYDDIVYVKIRDAGNTNIGDKFLIYQPLKKVMHPVTKQEYGRLIKVLGILRIIAKDAPETLTGRITLSFDSIAKGTLLTPYQEPGLIYETTPKTGRDIKGYILEVVDTRTINSQTDIVYLDKGSVDGVEAGDRFMVYTDPAVIAYPKKIIGEVQVFLVKEHTSTAVVRKTVDSLAKGDKIELKK